MTETNVIAINCDGDKRLVLINSLSYKDVSKAASEEFNVHKIKFFTTETDIEITEKIFPFYLKQHIVNPSFILSMKIINENLNESDSDDEMTTPILSNPVKMIRQQSATTQPVHVNIDSPSSSPHQFNIKDFQPFSMGVPTTSFTEREIKHVDDIRNIPDANIDIIFNYYKQRKKLENKERILLCKSIVKYLLEVDPARILLKIEFATISYVIAKCFKGEIASTYYMPAEHRSIAKGKLWNAYTNFRTQLSQAGLIKRRQKLASKSQVENTISTQSFVIKTEDEMDQHDDDMIFIKIVQQAPWEDICRRWNNTFTKRMNLLNSFSKEEYFNSFPCLKDPMGYELVKHDSTNLYPSIGNISMWPAIALKILETIQNNKSAEIRQILTSATTSESKNIAGFLVLPYLFPGKTTKGSNIEKSYRPNRTEIQRKFVAHYENETDADEEEEKLNDVLFQLKKPRVTLIGETLTTIESIYVSFGNAVYNFKNVLEAVEACFHFYTAFGIEYPQESNNLWLFLQKSVYGIETQHDLPNSLVETLINDLKNN